MLVSPLDLPGASKEKRAPSAYNVFMRTEVEKVKKANPSLKPAEAFKAAALNVIHFFTSLLLNFFLPLPLTSFIHFVFSGKIPLKTLKTSKFLSDFID